MNTEPVRWVSLLTAALVATWAVIAYAIGVSDTALQLGNVVIAAWVVFAGEFVRRRVTPAEGPYVTERVASAYNRGRADQALDSKE